MTRIPALAAVCALVLALAGCGTSDATSSDQATAEQPMELTLAHNLSETHVTSVALQDFADRVEESSEGRLTVKIFPNGQLGSETEVLEQMNAGVVDMTRVGAPGLAAYEEGYHAFGLPYIFDDQAHYYRAMDSEGMREFFASSEDLGFIGLTYYTSGARSFYTVDTPIREPEDLRGQKIRVQDFRSQPEMVNVLGGTPVVMPFGETYTALQTGVIDGAESNETVLTASNHGEVAKSFSMTEHTMIPDLLAISTRTWERLDPADRELVTEAAIASTEAHKEAWEVEIDDAVTQAEEMGVEFVTDVDKEAFREATRPMVDSYAEEYPAVADLLTTIDEAR